ncbi:MAG: GNAT family N-acetyltransferase, partial [Clostridia bacterium]|nr:GNAT family N-acetyltransferase [Clostridia bacterium]
IAFVAEDSDRIISTVFLHIVEMPPSPKFPNGLTGEVLNVYTKPEYRGRGICTKLMNMLLDSAKEHKLCRVDLSATEAGYPVYKKIGFKEKDNTYIEMRYNINE